MNRHSDMIMKATTQAVAATVLLTLAGQTGAVTYNLCAGTTTKTMPDTSVITMWGYGLDPSPGVPGAPCDDTIVSIPGPELAVPPGDDTLSIILRNELSEPVSIVVHGQSLPSPSTGPVPTEPGGNRVRSFTHEAPSGGSATYTFNNLRPGTFLYNSGTHPAVQVQMGLYGAVTHDAAVGEAYTGVAYDSEVTLLYSEIDPALHEAVAGENGQSYGPMGTMTSTVNYAPMYFLVNGAPFESGVTPAVSAGTAGQRTLIRLLNAGLEDHAIVLQGQHLTLVAEDGNIYPWPREEYSVLMAAGKTKDALFIPGSDGTYPVYDRRLRSGMLTNLSVAVAAPGPIAMDDLATVTEDSSANIIVVLTNDTPVGDLDPATVAIGTPAVNGLATANIDGSVSYTPNPDFNGVDSFTYTVRDTVGAISNAATVSVTVSPLNDNPVAVNDVFDVAQDSINNSLDVLGNDSDVDGDTLTITAVDATGSAGGAVTTNGTDVSYSPLAGYSGQETFGYTIADGNGGTAFATVTVTVIPAATNQAPVAGDDYATVTRNIGASTNSVIINVVTNDSDADGTVDATTVTKTSEPRKGIAVNNGDGTFTYTPTAGKRGSDAFGYTVNDDLGATSNEATVRVDILK